MKTNLQYNKANLIILRDYIMWPPEHQIKFDQREAAGGDFADDDHGFWYAGVMGMAAWLAEYYDDTEQLCAAPADEVRGIAMEWLGITNATADIMFRCYPFIAHDDDRNFIAADRDDAIAMLNGMIFDGVVMWSDTYDHEVKAKTVKGKRRDLLVSVRCRFVAHNIYERSRYTVVRADDEKHEIIVQENGWNGEIEERRNGRELDKLLVVTGYADHSNQRHNGQVCEIMQAHAVSADKYDRQEQEAAEHDEAKQ